MASMLVSGNEQQENSRKAEIASWKQYMMVGK